MNASSIVNQLLEWGGIFSRWNGFWMDPKGEMHRVDEHLKWARAFLAKIQGDVPDTLVYPTMTKLGWLRVVVENNKIYVKPQHSTRSQMAVLQEFAIENKLTIVDELTLRTLYDPREDSQEPVEEASKLLNKKKVKELPNGVKTAHGVVRKHGTSQAPGSEPWPGIEKVLK